MLKLIRQLLSCFEPLPVEARRGKDCSPLHVLNVFPAQCQCQSGWRENDNKCYFFSTDTKSWDEANAFCMEQNSHLMSIQDINERVRQNKSTTLWCMTSYRFTLGSCIFCVVSSCGWGHKLARRSTGSVWMTRSSKASGSGVTGVLSLNTFRTLYC